jgi:hypothetical protein
LSFNLSQFSLFYINRNLNQGNGRLIEGFLGDNFDVQIFTKEIMIERNGRLESMTEYSVLSEVNNNLSATKFISKFDNNLIVRMNEYRESFAVLINSLESIQIGNSQPMLFNNHAVLIEFNSEGLPVSYFNFNLGLENGLELMDFGILDSIYYLAGDVQVTSAKIKIGDLDFYFDEWDSIGTAGFTSTVSTTDFDSLNIIASRPPMVVEEYQEKNTIDISIFPNPFRDALQIEIDNNSSHTVLRVSLYSMLGAEVYSSDLEIPAGKFRKILPNTNLFPAGMYLVKIYSNDMVLTTYRIIKL